jgi:hypothetical protein
VAGRKQCYKKHGHIESLKRAAEKHSSLSRCTLENVPKCQSISLFSLCQCLQYQHYLLPFPFPFPFLLPHISLNIALLY